MRQLKISNQHQETSSSGRPQDFQQGNNYTRPNFRRPYNENWRSRNNYISTDCTAYNNRKPEDANMCFGHYTFSMNSRNCATWCKLQSEFNQRNNNTHSMTNNIALSNSNKTVAKNA